LLLDIASEAMAPTNLSKKKRKLNKGEESPLVVRTQAVLYDETFTSVNKSDDDVWPQPNDSDAPLHSEFDHDNVCENIRNHFFHIGRPSNDLSRSDKILISGETFSTTYISSDC